MPLEQYKTQVLLLHSEQSALDKLSAGFNDNYTVHCATSGFEALNTLGETPIHVIVSASNLPGMSGAEALREAKKRSPDTVGILIAWLGYQRRVFRPDAVRSAVGPLAALLERRYFIDEIFLFFYRVLYLGLGVVMVLLEKFLPKYSKPIRISFKEGSEESSLDSLKTKLDAFSFNPKKN